MLIDANLLLYAVDRASVHHQQAERWLSTVLRGNQQVGFPWQSLGGFRSDHHEFSCEHQPHERPASMECVQGWLDAGPSWIPPATERTASILGDLVIRHGVTANLVPDAMLAALAIENGITIMSADSDFARFSEARRENPLTA